MEKWKIIYVPQKLNRQQNKLLNCDGYIKKGKRDCATRKVKKQKDHKD